MISTSIDGSVGGSTQLFDLLSLLSDPKAYADKVQALEAATAESKKYVELVAPASDIMQLREVAQQDRALAEEELLQAKERAAEIISAAKEEASEIRKSANAIAKDIKARAQQAANDIGEQQAALDRALAAAKVAEAEAKRAASEHRKMEAEERAARDLANDAAVAAERVKESLLAKHQAFIDSLKEV